MQLSRSEQQGVVVLALSGRLIAGPDADRLEREIGEAVAAGERRILLDLAEVPWTDSTGLGVLIAAQHTVRGAGGTLKLCALSPALKTNLATTGLDRVFEVHGDRAQALASFQL